jgi:ADP-ribose pyrophosphatase YjhB (NUDIX family)
MTPLRPGYGVRHPALAPLLHARIPAAVVEFSWRDGTLPLRASSYIEVAALPDELVSSIRCFVVVGDRVVVCDTPDGCHPWPGGRREPGESYTDTACREVREETGWLLDPASVVPVGWIHLEHLEAQPADHPYLHPDFLQLVCIGRATGREDDAVEWVDTEGWEQASRLVSLDEARRQVTFDGAAGAIVFFDLINSHLHP